MNNLNIENINKELSYKEFVQRESNLPRAPYDPELEFYSLIRLGDEKKVKELCQQKFMDKPGLGILSNNPLTNIRYHFVITTAMIARYCIQGGMEVALAYSLSDFYIQKADNSSSSREVSDLHPVMCLDYTRRMRALRKSKICSRPVSICMDYIYDNLHTRITLNTLAKHADLSPSYLSRLFHTETGVTVSDYIQQKKIETAQNMLLYSSYTPSDIAAILAFPSQSYFTEIFRKRTGMTPVKYRDCHFRNLELKI